MVLKRKVNTSIKKGITKPPKTVKGMTKPPKKGKK